MSTGLLIATDDVPAALAAAEDHQGWQALRWPDDGLRLVERHWDRLGPGLNLLTEQTGVRALGPDEAAALPGVSTLAAMLTLLDDTDPRPHALVAEPGTVTGFVSTIAQLGYGQRRVLSMPLDVLAVLNRKLRGAAAIGAALPAAGELLTALRARDRWAAVLAAPEAQRRRAARHLALSGIAVLPADLSVPKALATGLSHFAEPWLEVAETASGYELLIRVAALERDATVLSRAGDDLIVTVDGVAHTIALPGGLRRCAVVGGSVTEDGLTIRFQPERGQWRG